MAELVDALVSNTNNFTVVPVRPRLRVPSRNFSIFFGNSGFFDSLNPLIDQRCRRSPNLFSGFDNRCFLNRRPNRWERAYFGTAVFGSSLPSPMFYWGLQKARRRILSIFAGSINFLRAFQFRTKLHPFAWSIRSKNLCVFQNTPFRINAEFIKLFSNINYTFVWFRII